MKRSMAFGCDLKPGDLFHLERDMVVWEVVCVDRNVQCRRFLYDRRYPGLYTMSLKQLVYLALLEDEVPL